MYADNKGSVLPSGIRPPLSSLSPYLDFDPAYVKRATEPEFILPEGAGEKRSLFDLACLKVGSCCIAGTVVGMAHGFYQGLKITTLEGQTGKLKRTTLLNHVVKRGASSANAMGVISAMYCLFGGVIEKSRGVENDEMNSIAAGTVTGLLYKSTAGLKKCAVGGAIGFSLATAYCLWTSKDKLRDFTHGFSKT